VRTKADLPVSGEGAADLAVCALDGWHLPALRRAHRRSRMGHFEHRRRRRRTPPARSACGNRRLGRSPCRPIPEVQAESLRAAVESLGELTGRIAPDDVLGRIFASFCIGK
jgi:tRNA modification GTPase